MSFWVNILKITWNYQYSWKFFYYSKFRTIRNGEEAGQRKEQKFLKLEGNKTFNYEIWNWNLSYLTKNNVNFEFMSFEFQNVFWQYFFDKPQIAASNFSLWLASYVKLRIVFEFQNIRSSKPSIWALFREFSHIFWFLNLILRPNFISNFLTIQKNWEFSYSQSILNNPLISPKLV
jgi:hypothetical protein